MGILFTLLSIALGIMLLKWSVGIKLSSDGHHGQTSVSVNPTFKRILTAVLTMTVYVIVTGASGEVKEGTRGVVLRNGAETGEVKIPGFYWVMPFVDRIEVMDVTITADTATVESASQDLQVVTTEVTVNSHTDPSRVGKVYHDYRHEIGPRAIRPAILEAVKASTAKFKAEELITRRAEVKAEIETSLRVRLDAIGQILDAVNVTDFDFSPEYNRAIEAKVTALQEALKAENDLKRIEVEAKQTVAKATAKADSEKKDADAKAYTLKVNAEAQAEALKLQKDAATKELIELRRVEAMLKALEKWDGKMPGYVGGGSAPVPVLGIFENNDTKK